jgi:hypothetical protein
MGMSVLVAQLSLVNQEQVLASFFMAIVRPRSCPTPMLAFYSSAAVVHFVTAITQNFSIRSVQSASPIVAMIAALGATLVMFVMPLRDPQLPHANISKVGEIATSELRSPEDNLTLWQFLTISWLEPLLTVGKTGKLSEEGVWSLGYEFQHKRLNDMFRQLRGSVVRRTVRANGVDLIITSLLGLIDALCGK